MNLTIIKDLLTHLPHRASKILSFDHCKLLDPLADHCYVLLLLVRELAY